MTSSANPNTNASTDPSAPAATATATANADTLPRHLHRHHEQSSSEPSPNDSSSPTDSPASRSPAASQSALVSDAALALTRGTSSSSTAAVAAAPPSQTPTSSSALASTSTTAPPGSPSSSSSNRFGLALGFIGRRPRGLTNPSSMSSGTIKTPTVAGGRSPGASSPSGELPPSPGTVERSGYGFPTLRRTLSKRAPAASPGNAYGSTQSGTSTSATSGEVSRTRLRRSSSQPPLPAGVEALESHTGSQRHRPRTATESGGGSGGAAPLGPPQPPFSALSTTSSLPSAANMVSTPTNENGPTSHRFRLVPHLESSRSLHFEPIDRDLAPFTVLRVGRFTDRSHHANNTDPLRIAFKSKVVSRGHAEIWADESGKFFIKDTKSSSGTFLNHIRLSGPNTESRSFALKDGDILQLGVDYQGGTEEIYRCVKMKVELNRGWQRGVNSFNTAALAQLRALGGGSTADAKVPAAAIAAKDSSTPTSGPIAQAASVTDCCICLYPVTVCQALFIAPCSHVTHFKCIRPLVLQNYPGFSCPLCRTYADLEADVEIDPPEPELPVTPVIVGTPSIVDEAPEEEERAAEASAGQESASPSISDGAARHGPTATKSPSASDAVSSTSGNRVAVNGDVTSNARSHEAGEPSADAPNGTSSTPNTPSRRSDTIAIPSSEPSAEQDAVYASLASAATPPNSTFLSTLAERGDTFVPRYRAPVASLDMALLSTPEAGPSSVQNGHRSSFGSDTDGANQDEDASDVVGVGKSQKGKGRNVDGSVEINHVEV